MSGALVLKDRGKVRVFAVEVDEVGAEMALLQKVAGAGEIVDPCARLFRPGLVAVEPLSEGPQRQAGRLAGIDQRLMCRLVNDEAVDAVEELLVGSGLQRRRRPRPGRGGRGHRFGGGNVLPVDVGHRGGLAVVCVVAELLVVHARGLRPHGAHGNFVELLHLHTVGDKRATGSRAILHSGPGRARAGCLQAGRSVRRR